MPAAADPLTIPLTLGELAWLWRKRHRYSVIEAARARGIPRADYEALERCETTSQDLAPPGLVPGPTDQERLRVLRRRSGRPRDDLARDLGISHVTWLKWERRQPPHPRIVAFWNEAGTL